MVEISNLVLDSQYRGFGPRARTLGPHGSGPGTLAFRGSPGRMSFTSQAVGLLRVWDLNMGALHVIPPVYLSTVKSLARELAVLLKTDLIKMSGSTRRIAWSRSRLLECIDRLLDAFGVLK